MKPYSELWWPRFWPFFRVVDEMTSDWVYGMYKGRSFQLVLGESGTYVTIYGHTHPIYLLNENDDG